MEKLLLHKYSRAILTALVLFLFMLVFLPTVVSEPVRDASVRRVLSDFFDSYLSRSLTDRELERVVVEFQDEVREVGKPLEYCGDKCRVTLAILSIHLKYFTKSPHTSKELYLRRLYIENSYNDPHSRQGVIYKLLNESDPVVVVDQANKFMTRRDVEAFLKLKNLVKTKKVDDNIAISESEIQRFIATTNIYFKGNKEDSLNSLAVAAAALHAGIVRDWDSLSPGDKKVTLTYLGAPENNKLPKPLLERFLSLKTSVDDSRPEPDMHGVLKKFFEAYLSRPMKEHELNKVVVEMQKESQKLDGGAEACGDICRIALTRFSVDQKYFTKKPYTPKELLLRRGYLANSFFNPIQQNTLTLKLLNEPNPAVVIDHSRKRLMSRRDIAAYLKLQTLAKTKKLDKSHKIKPSEIEETIAATHKRYGKDGVSLSILNGISSEMYFGIAREWDNLSEDDKKITLDYLGSHYAYEFPARLYQKFLGLNDKDAQIVANQQKNEVLAHTQGRLIEQWGHSMAIQNLYIYGINKMY
jgi:hypothetical protein